MASSLNSKRMVLMAFALVGLLAAVACVILLALGVREPTKERLFLVGSIFIVSVVCLFLSTRFKDDALKLQQQMREAEYVRKAEQEADMDDVALPQNAVTPGDSERG